MGKLREMPNWGMCYIFIKINIFLKVPLVRQNMDWQTPVALRIQSFFFDKEPSKYCLLLLIRAPRKSKQWHPLPIQMRLSINPLTSMNFTPRLDNTFPYCNFPTLPQKGSVFRTQMKFPKYLKMDDAAVVILK